MAVLKMRRICLDESTAAAQLAELRHKLGLQGEVVSPKGRQLTEAVFGEALPPVRVVGTWQRPTGIGVGGDQKARVHGPLTHERRAKLRGAR